MQPMPNESVQPDPGKREVFYGKATDMGWLSGEHKRRVKLSDSKRFAIGLFEPNKINFNDRNKTWVQLTNVGDEAIYADISSLSRRLGISKEKIIKLADADLIDGKHRLEDKIQKKIGKFLTLQKFVKCFSNKSLMKDLSEKEVKIISNYLEKKEISQKKGINNSHGLAREINENKKISKNFKKRDIDKFKRLANEIHLNKEIEKKLENTIGELAIKLLPEEFEGNVYYQNILQSLKGFINEKLSFNDFKVIVNLNISEIDNEEIKNLWNTLEKLMDRKTLSLQSIKERMDTRLLNAFFEKLPNKDIAFLKGIEQPLPEKPKDPEKITQNSRVWCDTRLIRSQVDQVVRVKLIDDPNVDRNNTYDVKTDGLLYYARPKTTDDFVPYTRDGKTWIRLDIQDLSKKLSLNVKEIRERGGLNLLIKERLDFVLTMLEKFSEVIEGLKKGNFREENFREELVGFYNEIRNLEGLGNIYVLAEELYRNLNSAVDYSAVIEKFVKEKFWWTPRTLLTKLTISPFKYDGLAISKAMPIASYGEGFKPSEGKKAVRLNLLIGSDLFFQEETNPFAIETDGYIYHQKPISTETHVAHEIEKNVWVLLNVNSLINRTSLYPPEVQNLALKDNENGKSVLLNEFILIKIEQLKEEQAPIQSIIIKSLILDKEFERKGEKIIDIWVDKINGMDYEKFFKLLVNDVQKLSIYKENEFFKNQADQLLRSLKEVSTLSSFKAILGELRQLVQP